MLAIPSESGHLAIFRFGGWQPRLVVQVEAGTVGADRRGGGWSAAGDDGRREAAGLRTRIGRGVYRLEFYLMDAAAAEGVVPASMRRFRAFGAATVSSSQDAAGKLAAGNSRTSRPGAS